MRITLFIILLVAAHGLLGQKSESLVFNEKVHDFGTIREDGGNADFEFTFTNNSGFAVTVTSVVASCGCTTPGWTKEPVAPGKSGFIKASYNPKGRPGYFNKTLTVTTNLDDGPISLMIKGNVTNEVAEADPNRLPYQLGSLQFKARTINFGKVYINKPATTQDFVVLNSGEKAVSIKEVKAPSYIVVQPPATLEPGVRSVIRLQYNAMLKNQYGFVSDNIEFVTDDESVPSKAFSVYATVEEHFLPVGPDEQGKVPVLVLSDESVDFGSISTGNTLQKEVNLRNSGRKDLTIRFVQPNCSCVSVDFTSDKIKAGETKNLMITWKGEGRKGTQNKAVTIYSTDPVHPVQRISLSGQIN